MKTKTFGNVGSKKRGKTLKISVFVVCGLMAENDGVDEKYCFFFAETKTESFENALMCMKLFLITERMIYEMNHILKFGYEIK